MDLFEDDKMMFLSLNPNLTFEYFAHNKSPTGYSHLWIVGARI
jgi:hypothetical protein